MAAMAPAAASMGMLGPRGGMGGGGRQGAARRIDGHVGPAAVRHRSAIRRRTAVEAVAIGGGSHPNGEVAERADEVDCLRRAPGIGLFHGHDLLDRKSTRLNSSHLGISY